MSRIWQKKSQNEIKRVIFDALNTNASYLNKTILGVPGSYLDPLVFDQEVPFLKDAPFLRSLLENPNHIGCHTLGTSEPFFAGTHAIEQELLDICAVDILKGQVGAYDGYVASGGTEANIQALWIYRNYYRTEFNAQPSEIAIICSEDSHYSVDKAANLLSIDISKVSVSEHGRSMDTACLQKCIHNAKAAGKKYFILICNMMTTMFGSVDNINMVADEMGKLGAHFKIHVDGAYGGFYYPFADKASPFTFENPHIDSFTLDAHKMAQSPYGTGIFLIRKGMIHYANTKEASYVKGEDYTLIGSRSGANPIAIWMILSRHGPLGWYKKIETLQDRTNWLAQVLNEHHIEFYRHPYSNIITIKNRFVDEHLANKYFLVPDNHRAPSWQKIVVMEHVTLELLEAFASELCRSTRGQPCVDAGA